MDNMTRRSFLMAAGAASAAEKRPNVLFLSVDDLNDWIGCLNGYPGVKTPNLDRLAQRGVLFSNAHCASPLCNPSRTALLTGLRASTTGIYNNEQWWRPVLPNVVTIPQAFRAAGYHVAGAGKVFHHVVGHNPPDQWDEFQLQEFDDNWYRRLDYYPWVKKVPNPPGHPYNGLKNFQGEFDWGVLPKPAREYGDMKAVNFGQQFLKRKLDKPFFLAIGLWHPHIPMFAPQSYFDLYPASEVRLPPIKADDLADLPPAAQKMAAFRRDEHERIVKEGKWRDAVRAYLASISFADAMIGQMLDALDESPYAKNTTIVFWSDNGWHLGEKQHWHKSTLWERSTHVPMIWAGAGIKEPGVTRTQPVNLLDIYPTLVDVCDLPKRSQLEGLSLDPLLRNSRAKRPPTVSTYLEGNHSVRDDRWRYTRYQDGSEELYDRHADPNEWENIANQARYTRLKAKLARWMPRENAKPAPEKPAYDFDPAKHIWRRK
jgi:arylsulfatase A-like enzyme